MSGTYKVGYKRPPRERQWKKGQTGNPGRQKPRPIKRLAELVDDCFAEPIKIGSGPSAQWMTTLQVFLTILHGKAIAHERGAFRALQQYLQFTKQRFPGGEIEIRRSDDPRNPNPYPFES